MTFSGKGPRDMEQETDTSDNIAPETVKPPRKPKLAARHVRKARTRGLISDKQMKKLRAHV